LKEIYINKFSRRVAVKELMEPAKAIISISQNWVCEMNGRKCFTAVNALKALKNDDHHHYFLFKFNFPRQPTRKGVSGQLV